jgi:hypothetical protein
MSGSQRMNTQQAARQRLDPLDVRHREARCRQFLRSRLSELRVGFLHRAIPYETPQCGGNLHRRQ